jgi:hypothetical protein
MIRSVQLLVVRLVRQVPGRQIQCFLAPLLLSGSLAEWNMQSIKLCEAELELHLHRAQRSCVTLDHCQ